MEYIHKAYKYDGMMVNDYTNYLLYSLYAGWLGEVYCNCLVNFMIVL